MSLRPDGTIPEADSLVDCALRTAALLIRSRLDRLLSEGPGAEESLAHAIAICSNSIHSALQMNVALREDPASIPEEITKRVREEVGGWNFLLQAMGRAGLNGDRWCEETPEPEFECAMFEILRRVLPAESALRAKSACDLREILDASGWSVGCCLRERLGGLKPVCEGRCPAPKYDSDIE